MIVFLKTDIPNASVSVAFSRDERELLYTRDFEITSPAVIV